MWPPSWPPQTASACNALARNTAKFHLVGRDVVLETAVLVSRQFFGGLDLSFGLEGLIDYIVQEATRMPPQPQSMSSHDAVTAVSPSDGDIANTAPPPKKPRSSLFASYTKKTASALVALQPVPLRCTLQAYIETASATQNASVKTVINNDQLKCLRPFINVLCASYLGPRGAHLYSLAIVEFSCALTWHA